MKEKNIYTIRKPGHYHEPRLLGNSLRLVIRQLTVRMVRRVRNRLVLERARVRARRRRRSHAIRLEEFMIDDRLQSGFGGGRVRPVTAVHHVRSGRRLRSGVQAGRWQCVRVHWRTTVVRVASVVPLSLVRD